jgi:hypothetical protein
MRVHFALILILALVGVAAAQHKSSLPVHAAFDPRWERHLKRITAKMRVEVMPDRPNYMEGEDIWLTIDVHSDSTQVMPWSDLDILGALNLFSSGSQLKLVGLVGASDMNPTYPEPRTEAEWAWQINGHYCPTASDTMRPFCHLIPGHYAGYFWWGVQSHDFSFDILPATPEFQAIWNVYACLSYYDQRIVTLRSYSATSIADSVHSNAPRILALPTDSPYQRELSRVAASVMAGLHGWWTNSDSLLFIDLVYAYASSHRATTAELGELVNEAFFSNTIGATEYKELLLKMAEFAPTERPRSLLRQIAARW